MLASFFFLYVGFFGFTGGDDVLPEGPVDGAIGGSVLFSTTLTPPETPFTSVIWNFGAKNIGFSTPSGQTIQPQYQGRATIFHSTGSLELRSLTAADSGDYGVSIVLANGSLETGSTTLRVHVPVSSVTIDPETVNLVEFNDSLKLSCSSSGSSLSFLWIKDGSDVTASDRVQITDGGKTLTIVNVTRDDQGTYTCKVSNPVSSATSRPSNVTVYWSPDDPSGCAAGCIAGIVIACIILVVALVGGGFFIHHRKRNSEAKPNVVAKDRRTIQGVSCLHPVRGGRGSGTPPPPPPGRSEQEPHYENISAIYEKVF